MFLSKKPGTHNHLERKIAKKHSTLHSVTSGEHKVASMSGERPFAPIHLDNSDPSSLPPKKSIFGL
jgi:hypothetical protein